MNTKRITRTAIIGALYTALTLAVHPIAYGQVQFRISEALTVLPLFYPEAIVGLTVGCFISNIFGNGILDMVFGTLATLLASLSTYFLGRAIKRFSLKLILAEIPPVLFNAVIVPFTFLALTELKDAYFISMVCVGAGQLAVIGTLGTVLAIALYKLANKSLLNDTTVSEYKDLNTTHDEKEGGQTDNL